MKIFIKILLTFVFFLQLYLKPVVSWRAKALFNTMLKNNTKLKNSNVKLRNNTKLKKSDTKLKNNNTKLKTITLSQINNTNLRKKY